MRAWTSASKARIFAFGDAPGPLAPTVVLLHRDRLNIIARLVPEPQEFGARWHGLLTGSGKDKIAFLVTSGGASDVGDCLLHLAVIPPERLIFTGTCGSLRPDIEIGQVCIASGGWAAESFLSSLDDPVAAIHKAVRVPSRRSSWVEHTADYLESCEGIRAISVAVFTTASQACESKAVLTSMRQLGADVVDMEAAVALAVAQACDMEACALLWCTDRPAQSSYYSRPCASEREVLHRRWQSWPSLVLRVAQAAAKWKDRR